MSFSVLNLIICCLWGPLLLESTSEQHLAQEKTLYVDDGKYGDEDTVSGFYSKVKSHKTMVSIKDIARQGWGVKTMWMRLGKGPQGQSWVLLQCNRRDAPQKYRWIITTLTEFSMNNYVHDTHGSESQQKAFPRLVCFPDLSHCATTIAYESEHQ